MTYRQAKKSGMSRSYRRLGYRVVIVPPTAQAWCWHVYRPGLRYAAITDMAPTEAIARERANAWIAKDAETRKPL